MRSSPILLLFLSCLAVEAADLGRGRAESAAMRWRTCTDRTAGVTFRYPYELRAKDQLEPAVFAGSGVSQQAMRVIQGPNGRVILEPVAAAKPPGAAVRLVSKTLAELPEAMRGDRNAIATELTGVKATWVARDYYAESATRPFVGKKATPPADVAGLAGDDTTVSAVVWFHGDRASALVVAKSLDSATDRILDSFEVLVPGAGKKGPTSWRERQCAKNVVLDEAGNEVPAGAKNVAWAKCWEYETEHYHVTGHLSPARLIQHGKNLEALYATYSGLFEPDKLSPFKFEVHVFTDFATFQSVSAAWGHGFTVRPGEVIGGFFVPALQSLWVYEESGRLGGPPMEIEHVMAHECSHQFLHMACNGSDHVPTWFNEGVAVHFESGKLANGVYRHAMPVDRINRLRQIYRDTKTTLVPLEQYLDHRHGIPADSYAEVYAMMHFWVFGAQGGRKRFVEYWKAMKGGEDGAKAFERIFMDDLIKAKGSREAALKVWQDMLVEYVVTKLK